MKNPSENPVKLETILGVRVNSYKVLIDNEEWCTANNDTDGFKLMTAIAILDLRRKNEG